jgi:hypothetical protein
MGRVWRYTGPPSRERQSFKHNHKEEIVRKMLYLVIVLVLSAGLVMASAVGKTHRVEFATKAIINGVELEPGQYRMKVDEADVAEFYSGRTLVAKAKVEIQPIGSAVPNSVSQRVDGQVVEIRLRSERVVLVES